jgi:hypothetical protein
MLSRQPRASDGRLHLFGIAYRGSSHELHTPVRQQNYLPEQLAVVAVARLDYQLYLFRNFRNLAQLD